MWRILGSRTRGGRFNQRRNYHVPTPMDVNTIRPVKCENPAGCLSGGTRAARFQVRVPQGTEYVPVGTRSNPFLGSTNSWFYMGTASYHAANISLVKGSQGGLSCLSRPAGDGSWEASNTRDTN